MGVVGSTGGGFLQYQQDVVLLPAHKKVHISSRHVEVAHLYSVGDHAEVVPVLLPSRYKRCGRKSCSAFLVILS